MAASYSTPIGTRFCRLVVCGLPVKIKKYVALPCRCDCGTEKTVERGNLMAGRTKSCGCLNAEMRSARSTHGQTTGFRETRAYKSWCGIKDRCCNPKNSRWSDYGGRGISVCERWRASFENFLADMGDCPPGYSIDRYPDVDGNYEPGNCRWATDDEQRTNKRDSHFLEHDGLRLTISQWSTRTGLDQQVIWARIKTLKWGTARALTEPPRKLARRTK